LAGLHLNGPEREFMRDDNELRKSLVDGIEEALIQLQYALADYYIGSEGDSATDAATLAGSLRELRARANSTQLAIDLLRRAVIHAGSIDKSRPPHG
jgi:hypothetical protein